MANVLIDESFLTGLADNIREKTGRTEKMKPSEMLAIAQEEWGSGGGSESTRITIVPETTLNGFTEADGIYGLESSGAAQSWIVANAEYIMVFDGVEYICTVTEPSTGIFAIGNISLTDEGFENTGEPFLLIYQSSNNAFAIVTTIAGDSHTVAVYQESTSGGSSGLVKYVTFMNYDGTTALYEKPTISGDDCVDVVAKGLMDEPTKESSNTTNYTHNGWSLTAGGSADSSALLNVTEDRNVYAAFAESTRYYTVNFYTEEGVLHESVQVEYGGTATPSTEPKKSGYGFEGWSPSNENITADTNCYAVWSESITFANASWADIAAISESGQAANTFAVGDTKSFNMTIADGTTQTVTFAIVGFDFDTLSDGSGKAGITLMQVGHMNDQVALDDIGIFEAEENKYLSLLPSELSSVIKSVNKMFENNTVSSKIWAMDANEILDNYTNTTYVDAFDTSTSLFPIFEGKTELQRAQIAGFNGRSMIRSKRTIDIPKCRGNIFLNTSNKIGIFRMYDAGLITSYYQLCFCI